jgi:hypothetical protein
MEGPPGFNLLTVYLTGFYIENFSHRNHWLKLFVTFNPQTQVTSAMLHNLIGPELDFIQGRLNDAALHALTVHPMFVVVLVMELLFNETLVEARAVFGNSIRLQHKANLHDNEAFKHLVDENLNIEDAASRAFGNEQRILVLLEKMEFAIKMGKKAMSWIEDLELTDSTDEQKSRFKTSGQIICNRFEYLLDGLDLQLIRVKRARSHSQLNRTGVSKDWHKRLGGRTRLTASSSRLETQPSETNSTRGYPNKVET